jgi:hypothetical protein
MHGPPAPQNRPDARKALKSKNFFLQAAASAGDAPGERLLHLKDVGVLDKSAHFWRVTVSELSSTLHPHGGLPITH